MYKSINVEDIDNNAIKEAMKEAEKMILALTGDDEVFIYETMYISSKGGITSYSWRKNNITTSVLIPLDGAVPVAYLNENSLVTYMSVLGDDRTISWRRKVVENKEAI